MENKTNEFEGKEILKSDEAAKLLGITDGYMTSATITDTVRYENGRSRFKNF